MIGSILLTLAAGQMPALYVRIEGDGYLRFAKGTQIVYARQAKLTPTAQGLVASDGSMLVPRLVAPANTTKLAVSLDGAISAQSPAGTKSLGRLVIAVFDAKAGFVKVGNYVSTTAKPTLTNPGEWIAGVIRSTPLVATKTTQGNQVSKPNVQTGSEAFYKPTAEVVINSTSQVKSDHILLGEIAKIDGDPELKEKLSAVDFGKAPIYGAKRGMTLIHVRANILAAHIDLTNVKITVPEGASVERESQRVEPSDIAKAVSDALKSKFGFDTKLQEKHTIYASNVPLGKLNLDVTQLTMGNSEVSGYVDISVDGKLVNSTRVEYELPALPGVKRGDVVRLRMKSNFATVEVSGKAASAAYLGQTLSVQTDNGTTVTGTLIGANLVEVKL